MSKFRATPLHALLAMAILGLLAMPLAFAGAADGPSATSSVVTNAKFKKLKKRVAALEGKVNTPASGDLTGTYPNLQIAANAVGTNEIAANAVTTAKIADGAVANAKIADDAVNAAKILADAVGSSEIAGNAVGNAELAPITARSGITVTDIVTASAATTTANCNAGEQALSPAGTWDAFNAGSDGQELSQLPAAGTIGTGIVVGVSNQSGATRSFTPGVFCLAP